MEIDYYEELAKLVAKMQFELKSVDRITSRAIGESLMISKHGNGLRYEAVKTTNGSRKRRLVNTDPEEIYRLANLMYLRFRRKGLEHDLKLLKAVMERLLAPGPDGFIASMPAHFETLDMDRVLGNSVRPGLIVPRPVRDVEPRVLQLELAGMSPELWAALPYCENTSHLESKTHRAANGLLCRSKSEAAILGIYDRLGIPYHYDEVVYANGLRVSPDVLGVRRDLRFMAHEHKGLSSQEYRDRDRWKSFNYEAAGFFPGVNLIVTYDDEYGNLNARLAEEMIRDAYKL